MHASPRPACTSADDNAAGVTLCVLASGSKGNAVYVSAGETAILIDAGLSGIEIERRLRSRGLQTDSLKAIVVSHEHADHVHGVGILSRRHCLPVYMNRKTAGAADRIGNLPRRIFFECGTAFNVDRLWIHPFSLSHDALDPAGFTLQYDGIKIGIATDLGRASAVVTERLRGCRALVLEANHDSQMLLDGPYPWPLKQRIQSRVGHLSNADSKSLLCDLVHDNLEHVILAHLSDTNNTPETALRDVSPALSNSRASLKVAVQDRCTELIHLD